MAKLSVIICVYNTNINYLKECLHSVFLSATKDLEVILIDDGSTVDYSQLISSFDGIKYIKTENKGTLQARILGAEQSTGDYIAYIDSDDTVSPMYYTAMLKMAKKSKADIIVNDWACHTKGAKYYCKRDETICKDLDLQNEEVLDKFMTQEGLQHSFYVLWNKIYKKELILKAMNEIKALGIDRMLFAEDVLITFYASIYAKKMINTHVGYYFYRMHENQETFVSGKEKLKKHIICQSYVFDKMEEKLKDLGLWEKYSVNLENWKKLLAYGNYATAKRQKFLELVPIIKEKYRMQKLKMNFYNASYYYDNQVVLPLNLEELDKALLTVILDKNIRFVNVKNGYAKKQLKNITYVFEKDLSFVHSKNADIVFPKEKYSWKQRLIHNVVVCKIGLILFPKGSKIRKKLKSYL